ncbi:MAG: LysM peptidoglycan-binding domain-containing protein [Deltaproteobacteria bacterium]
MPKLIAAILIAKDPARYGFTGMNYNEPVLYEKVNVPSPTDINIIAEAAQTDVEEIKSLNPELKRWFTPPDYKNYEVKVPLGKGELVREKLESMPKQELIKFLIHKVKRGETLSQIARRYGTELKPLMYLNAIKNVRRLKPGDQIAVPVRAAGKAVKNAANSISKAGTAKKHILN